MGIKIDNKLSIICEVWCVMEGPIHECERLKDEGNMHLKANTFEQAIQSYTQAIEIAGRGKEVPEAKIAVYLANRAFAHIKMESYGLAIADAQASIAHNPSY